MGHHSLFFRLWISWPCVSKPLVKYYLPTFNTSPCWFEASGVSRPKLVEPVLTFQLEVLQFWVIFSGIRSHLLCPLQIPPSFWSIDATLCCLPDRLLIYYCFHISPIISLYFWEEEKYGFSPLSWARLLLLRSFNIWYTAFCDWC